MALLRSGTRIYGNATIDTVLEVNGEDTATSNLTGALKVKGGVGVTGNIFTSEKISAANANLGNLVIANYYTGTLTSSNQPNITSVGNLTNLTVTGNSTLGNIATANYFTGTLTTANQPNITTVGNLASLNVLGVTDLSDISNVRISGGSNGYILTTYGNGNLYWGNSGFFGNANVSGNATEIQFNNGINLGSTPNLTFDTSINLLTTDYIYTNFDVGVEGNLNVTTSLSVQGNATITTDLTVNGNLTINGTTTTVNSTTITTNDKSLTLGYDQNTSAALDGAGIDVGNNAIATWRYSSSNNAWKSNIAIIANGNITASGNINANSASLGNAVSANYFIGNASFLVGIDKALRISNGSSNVAIPNVDGNVLISVANVANVLVISNSGINVSGYVTVTGNITGGNANLGNLITGNITSGNANLGNLAVANYITGTLTSSAQPNITSVGTLTSLGVTGNITSGNANLGNLAVANYITGTLTTSAQPNITSVGTLTSVSVTGNTSTGNLTGANLVSANYVTGTLTTSAQPNITSVGNLTNLNIAGNLSLPNGHLSIGNSFGSNNQVLKTYNNTAVWSTTFHYGLMPQIVGLITGQEVAVNFGDIWRKVPSVYYIQLPNYDVFAYDPTNNDTVWVNDGDYWQDIATGNYYVPTGEIPSYGWWKVIDNDSKIFMAVPGENGFDWYDFLPPGAVGG